MTDSAAVASVELAELARDCGVTLSYVDGRGTTRRASTAGLLRVLNSFDDDLALQRPDDAAGCLRRRRESRVEAIVEPVYVVEEGVESAVVIRLRRRPRMVECRLELEHGDEVVWSVSGEDLSPWTSGVAAREGGVNLVLPPLRAGYHRLHVRVGRRDRSAAVFVRPLDGARGRFGSDWRAFGVVTPVYALHSRSTWGAGDVGDLEKFAQIMARQQATVIATLPMLAGFGPHEFEASPYRPVSRRFWHDRYISMEMLDELSSSSAARAVIDGAYPPRHRATWIRDGLIDGAASLSAKRRIVQLLAETASADSRHSEEGLRNFTLAHPDVTDYARFRAAGESFGLNWRTWSSTARSGLLRWNDVDPVLVRYHTFAQWIIDEQMGQVASSLAQRGQTLGLDIPIGVHPDGYDVWRHRHQYADDMTIGAPPDALAAEGQKWGSPPVRPEQSRRDAHVQFREALRFHMKVAGIVRLDHVLGLQRMFWVPHDASAHDGMYVSMPLDELLAVVAIEAQRARVDVVGEDLGTVAGDLRDALRRSHVRRTYVAQFAIETGASRLDDPPAESVATFSTHDTPTFVGWWQGRDVEEREKLHLIDAASAERESTERVAARASLCRAMGEDDNADSVLILDKVYETLARSDAGLVMMPLDDLIGEAVALNMPGTSSERPNWNRRCAMSLEALDMASTPDERLHSLRELRGLAVDGEGPHSSSIRTYFDVTLLTRDDIHLFNEGRLFDLHNHLGSHVMQVNGVDGCYFSVWAPNAVHVSVVGDFNSWDGSDYPLRARDNSGIWEGFLPGVVEGSVYKYRVSSRLGGPARDKADPLARWCEVPSATASRTWTSAYVWPDNDTVSDAQHGLMASSPMSIYEVHLGSWRRIPEQDNRSLTYRECAEWLVPYVTSLGFTHVEFLPVMEHPFYGSWGYQTTSYFAPSARYGTPDDFRFLVSELHQAGIGVILDWVPSHFPSDAFALAEFDGTHLYEHADERQRVHPDWQSWIFNYGRNEVRSFLISNAMFWIEEFHIDGLRIDAVASMLYLDYSRSVGEWVPNRYGGREDLDAVEFLRQLTSAVTERYPGVTLIAEESTAWPGVTSSPLDGGLGFDLKWDMGWMHDTLNYLSRDPIYRKFHYGEITFRELYASTESFTLPLSHDEVVHGKGSLLSRMPGDEWQRFANLRLLFGYQFTISGKKLLFMGDEFGQSTEWSHDNSLDWHEAELPLHAQLARWITTLNAIYVEHSALHNDEQRGSGFSWVQCDDATNSVLVWRRVSAHDELLVAINFTPTPLESYVVHVQERSSWDLVICSDDAQFGGSDYLSANQWKPPVADARGDLKLRLAPLGLLILKRTTQ